MDPNVPRRGRPPGTKNRLKIVPEKVRGSSRISLIKDVQFEKDQQEEAERYAKEQEESSLLQKRQEIRRILKEKNKAASEQPMEAEEEEEEEGEDSLAGVLPEAPGAVVGSLPSTHGGVHNTVVTQVQSLEQVLKALQNQGPEQRIPIMVMPLQSLLPPTDNLNVQTITTACVEATQQAQYMSQGAQVLDLGVLGQGGLILNPGLNQTLGGATNVQVVTNIPPGGSTHIDGIQSEAVVSVPTNAMSDAAQVKEEITPRGMIGGNVKATVYSSGTKTEDGVDGSKQVESGGFSLHNEPQ